MKLQSASSALAHPPLRPREKLSAQGPETLNDAELLSVILGTGYKGLGVRQLANHLLAQFGSKGLLQFNDLSALQQETGLPPVKSCMLLAMGEYFRRLQRRDSVHIKSSEQLYEHLKEDFSRSPFEQLRIVCTDAQRRVLHSGLIAQGKANTVSVSLAEVFHDPIRLGAQHFYLAHNHPKGPATPSAQDTEFTLQVKDAAKAFGLAFQDHIIVGEGGFYSFSLNGML